MKDEIKRILDAPTYPACHWTGPEQDCICVNWNTADPFEEAAGLEPCCPECQTYLGDE